MKILTEIREKFSSVNRDIKQKAKKLEQFKQKRDYLHNAPVTPKELADGLCGIIDAKAQRYPETLARMEKNIRHQPFYDIANSGHGIMAPFSLKATVSPEALAWLCGDVIKQRIHDAVKHQAFIQEWGGFDDAGPPLLERKKRIAELDVEIEALEKEIDEIRQSAQAAIAALDG